MLCNDALSLDPLVVFNTPRHLPGHDDPKSNFVTPPLYFVANPNWVTQFSHGNDFRPQVSHDNTKLNSTKLPHSIFS
ncbi:hypothetical protein LINGRAHAP2_LOCUS27465 [Linum grandiflorum]